jgi:hypothetical protein
MSTRTSSRQLALIYTEKAEVELMTLDRSEQSPGWHGSSEQLDPLDSFFGHIIFRGAQWVFQVCSLSLQGSS